MSYFQINLLVVLAGMVLYVVLGVFAAKQRSAPRSAFVRSPGRFGSALFWVAYGAIGVWYLVMCSPTLLTLVEVLKR